jgi:hypothetical protein
MDPAGTANSFMADSDFPRDVTILTTNMTVTFEDGTRADSEQGVYTHHTVAMDLAKSTPTMMTCDGSSWPNMPMSIFMGGSEDKGGSLYTTPDGKFHSGYCKLSVVAIHFVLVAHIE